MTRKPVSNLAESIRQKLLNQSKGGNEDFQLVLNRYFRERFLFRLGESRFRNRYLLKGAALLVLWEKNPYRSTMDLDLLRMDSSSMDSMESEFREICSQEALEDGVYFDPESISLETIRSEQEYMGLRAHVTASLGKIRTRMQIDVGNGDAVWPTAKDTEYPVILNMPSPNILSYAPETVIAEKFEAMVVHGIANSRIKDFFDITRLAGLMRFRGQDICEAISRTFAKRKTPIPDVLPVGLEPEYWDWQGREQQVKAFSRHAKLSVTLTDAKNMTPFLKRFLGEPVQYLSRGTPFNATWEPGGPWS
jgi:hypothetical protein